MVREAHAGIVFQCAIHVNTRTERHPYAEGGSPGFDPAVTLRIEFVLAAQGTAATLQIADTCHIVSRLKQIFIFRCNINPGYRFCLPQYKDAGINFFMLMFDLLIFKFSLSRKSNFRDN